ncbi:MAG: glutamate synthase subunit beta [Clostridia bacterium]|nr:glutamate synthase subunit beta [Clostridia bacterium]
MGKATGFIEYQRAANPSIAPEERINNFCEFHPPLDESARREQAARCMDCGVPFCQSGMNLAGMFTGCPLNNVIPEWNDMLYRGNWSQALSRLLKRSSFPEFTGRVCPALCEAACTCGLNDQPVTVRENELAIIEHAFANGLMTPRIPETRTGRRVAVIGSGPSGLALADRLNRRGHIVTVYEKNDRPGGLLMYGIPNMKLDKSVVDRRIKLMTEEGVTFKTGVDVGANMANSIIGDYDAVALCCGAGNPRDLNVKNRDAKGCYFAVDFLTENTKSLLEGRNPRVSAKGKSVVIVGGGDTGNDCVGTCIRQGCKSVIQLEMMPCPPLERTDGNPWPQWPRILKTDYGQQEAIALYGSDPRIYQTTVTELVKSDKKELSAIKTVKLEKVIDEKSGRANMMPVEGSEETLECQLLLIAAGFLGCQDYAAKAFGVKLNGRQTVETRPGSYATNVEKVFSAGDMRRGQSLVVWAINEGRQAASEIDGYLMGYSNPV